jgi:hypothetical protein
MQRTNEGRVRYLLAFQDAPWRDGDEITVDQPLKADDDVKIADGPERRSTMLSGRSRRWLRIWPA